MAHMIPFHQSTFRPKLAIKGNEDSDRPVEFDLSAAAGPDHARVKSLIYGTAALLFAGAEWTPTMQASVLEAFRTGGSVFERTVDAIRHLTVPASLALRAGVIQTLGPGMGLTTPVPIETGPQFARISGYCPILAFEVVKEIGRLSDEGEIDLRFFGSLITSRETSPAPSGSAGPATTGSAGSGTAAVSTPPA